MKKTKVNLLKAKILLVFFSLILSSCIKDELEMNKFSEDMDWNPNMALPLAKGSLSVRDLVMDYDNEELIEEDETGFLYLIYNKRILSYRADSMIKIPNQSFSDVFTAAADLNPSTVPVGSTVSESHSLVFDIAVNSTEALDSIRLKSAELNVQLNSDFEHPGTLVIQFPTIKKGSVVYTKTINIPAAGGTVTNNYTDMEGYSIDLTGTGAETNKLPINYTLTLTNSGNPVAGSDQISLTVGIVNIKYSSMFGYLGNYSQDFSMDSIHLEIFNQVLDGEAYFDDPRMYVRMNNSYGLPVQFYLTSLGTYSTTGAPSTPLFGTDVPTIVNPRTMMYPTLSQIGQFASDMLSLNKTNSNIMDVVETQPKYIFFSVESETNPLGPGFDYNFVTDSSRFDLELEVELPLYGNAKYWLLQDTADLDFSALYEDLDIIDWINFRLVAENGMPTEARLQVYFVDSNYVMVDSLISNELIIQSGGLDAAGKVVSPTTLVTNMRYEHDRIQNLKDVKYILYSGTVNTTNAATELVRFYSHYNIDIGLGAQVQVKIDDSSDLE
ncbi:MAG: hypothetical protein JXR58_05540 [Bacteroidales bacterium]|nr:hypothetical protein [Bacteroidales bacterium]